MKTIQKGFIVPLLLIIAAILLAGGGAYFYTQTKSENSPVTENVTLPQATSTAQTTNSKVPTMTDTSAPVIETKYTTDFNQTTNPDGSATLQQLVFVSPSKNRIAVPTNVALQISGAIRFLKTGQRGGQDLAPILISNPINQDQLILTTTSEGGLNSSGVVGRYSFLNYVYSYDLRTNELNLLATSTYKSDVTITLETIGSKSSKVILVYVSGSPGPCASPWLAPSDRYAYLDMNNLDAGLQPYVVPAEKIKLEQANDVKCRQNIDLYN